MEINQTPDVNLSIDPEVLKLNLSALGDDAAECLAFLTETFCEDSPELLHKMRTGAEKGDADQVRFNAHTMKSSGATLGATRLTQLCQDLETQSRNGNLVNALELVRLIEAEFEHVKVGLINFKW